MEVVLAIAFAATNFKKARNAAAVLEWTIAFIFTFYVFSFFIDLLPAVKTKEASKRFGSSGEETQMQMEEQDGEASERTLGVNDQQRAGNGFKEGQQAPLSSNF